jgi:hypothetical protein
VGSGERLAMSSETEIENWERLAAKYLRRLAAEDMRQWERHWRLESLSRGPDAESRDKRY